MSLQDYLIFSSGKIASLRLKNRLVRSAVWDPCIVFPRRMSQEVLDIYQALARGGVGMIITGGVPVISSETLHQANPSFRPLQVDGFEEIASAVHEADTHCRVFAQLETLSLGAGPSELQSPFQDQSTRALSIEEIQKIISCFVEGIGAMRQMGFDGVQLHAAHGSLLSRFLSPYSNRRDDAYGGSTGGRVCILREIIAQARSEVGSFPIIIKINGTDYLPGGIDIQNLPELAGEVVAAGVDAIELSGGMPDCLALPEEALGFARQPTPEAHTRIHEPENQSYFLAYARVLRLPVPLILVGGNRRLDLLESILREGSADFFALARPLIREPDLPRRWLTGRGRSARCISCNACLYAMRVHPGMTYPAPVTCIYQQDREQYKKARRWLVAWVRDNLVDPL